jgi:hypothetical protein
MYMERIEVAAETAAPRKPKALKLAAGLAFLIVSALVTVPWFCIVAVWMVVAGGARGLGKLGRFIHDTLCYAGELVVGR